MSQLKKTNSKLRKKKPKRVSLYMNPARRGGGAVRNKNKHGRLLLSNVGPNIQLMDMFDMFSAYGPVERLIIHCNDKSRKIGTAEVWMSSRTDAKTAKRKINNTDVFNDGIY
jgi:hypothetical protein